MDTITGGAVPRSQRRLERGVCVGRYVVVGWVGEGGMGVVYKAYDPELERAVALKLLHASGDPDSSSATLRRDRLLREAKALARLSHPNVLAVFDVGTFGNDVFLATEFVEGPTLADWLKDAKPSRAAILAAMLDAGEGLAAAHRAGLVHRDFKPANAIMGKDGRVRVLDFGLARAEPIEAPSLPPLVAPPHDATSEESTGPETPHAIARISSAPRTLADISRSISSPLLRASESVEARSEHSSGSLEAVSEAPASRHSTSSPGLLDLTITQHGQILGTPRFMAPEQHLGRTADARSDQFSFCLSLYEALYGEFPFEGKGEAYAANVTRGRLRNAPAGSDVPRWIRAVLLRGLSVAQADRYPSMDELLAALRKDPAAARRRWFAVAGGAALLLGAGLAVRHVRPTEAPCRGAERKLAGVWDDARKLAVRSAFSATGAAGAEDAFTRASAALDDYSRRWVTMHTDACEATQVRGEQSAEMLDLRVQCLNEDLEELRAQVDVFAHADASAVAKAVQASRALPRIQACADAASLRAPIRPPSDEATRTRVDAVRSAIAQAKAQQRSGSYGSALSIATKAAADATSLAYRPVEAEALYVLADVQDDEGDYATSERTFRKSFAAALAGHHEVQAARALTALVAEVGLRQARFPEAHDWAAIAEAETERSTDPFVKGELARNEGRLFVREDDYESARAAIERCLSIWEPAFGTEDYVVAGPRTDLGNVFFLQGNLEAARAEYARSLAVLEKILGPNSPSLAPNLNNLGEMALGRGEYDASVAALTRAHDLWEGALGPDHPKVALTLFNLSRARRAQGEIDEAKTLAERALEIWKKALPPEHPDVALGMHGVAEALRSKHEYAEALAMEEKALAIREKVFGADGYALAESLVSIGETRLAEGLAVAAAVAPLERAIRILERRGAVSPSEIGQAKFDLARALPAGEATRAEAAAEAAREAYARAGSPLGTERTAEIDAWLAQRRRP